MIYQIQDTFRNISGSAVLLRCHELNLTAVVDEQKLGGRLMNLTLSGCPRENYTITNESTLYVDFKECAASINETNTTISQVCSTFSSLYSLIIVFPYTWAHVPY